MFFSTGEKIGGIFAVIIVVIMGFIAFHKPFNVSARKQTSSFNAGQAMAPIHVSIVTDPKTIGAYRPAKITAHVGQKIIWTNSSNVAHTVTDRSSAFDSGNIAIGASYQYAPTKPGTYFYVCIYHPLMLGTLVVK